MNALSPLSRTAGPFLLSVRQSLELDTGVNPHSLALCFTARLRTRSPISAFRSGAVARLQPEMNNEINVLPIRLYFINIHTYPNPKPTPYNNEKIVIIVVLQCDKNYAALMCACPVAPYVFRLALTLLRGSTFSKVRNFRGLFLGAEHAD